MAEIGIIIAAIIGSLGFIIAIVDLFFTYQRTKVIGPNFVIPYVELVTEWGTITDTKTNYIGVKPSFKTLEFACLI